MRITTKGQVTIPEEIRSRLGLLPHTEVRFIQKGKHVYLEKIAVKKINRLSRGRRIVEHLRGTATTKMTTEEIMALTRGD